LNSIYTGLLGNVNSIRLG